MNSGSSLFRFFLVLQNRKCHIVPKKTKHLLIVSAMQVEIFGIVAVSNVAHAGLVKDCLREGLQQRRSFGFLEMSLSINLIFRVYVT